MAKAEVVDEMQKCSQLNNLGTPALEHSFQVCVIFIFLGLRLHIETPYKKHTLENK